MKTSAANLYFQGSKSENSMPKQDVKRLGMVISGKIPYIITSRGYDILQKETYPPEVLQSLSKDMHILDVGTGDGLFVSDLQNKGYKYAQGIDIGDALPANKSFLKKIAAEAFECPNNSLDRIFSSYSIFCYPESPEFRIKVLQKMCNWLKPGGEIHLAPLESTSDLKKLISQIPSLQVMQEGKNDSYIRIAKLPEIKNREPKDKAANINLLA